MKKHYPGEPFNIHLQSLTNIIQGNNWVITTKKVRGKLPIFSGNIEWVIPIYGEESAEEEENGEGYTQYTDFVSLSCFE